MVGILFIVISGYLWMSSGGNQESVDTAKSMFQSSITAMVILFAGYILLKAINPDLLQFQSIQPPNIVLPDQPTGSGFGAGSGATTSNDIATDLTGSGCVFAEDKQKIEAAQMTPKLVTIVKGICWNVLHNYSDTAGHPVRITSVIGMGLHAANSYHYKGCAVDFGDAGGNGFFSLANKTGRATGVAIYKEALNAGISASRIDPGVDATRTDMLHIDLGSACPNSGSVDTTTD